MALFNQYASHKEQTNAAQYGRRIKAFIKTVTHEKKHHSDECFIFLKGESYGLVIRSNILRWIMKSFTIIPTMILLK